MELAPSSTQEIEQSSELLNDGLAREIAIMALISVLKDPEDYASGPDFPNIPFGD